MSGTITHKWDGTVLTITSDAGTSSCDLKGEKGDMGVRGAQGATGVLVDASGVVIAPADNYYSKEQVDDVIADVRREIDEAVANVDVDIDTEAIEESAINKATAIGKNIFASALKGSAAGTAIAIDDVSQLEHEMAVKVSSKNLLHYPYYETTKTQNGVTFTDNGDGSLTINGTSTADTPFTMIYKARQELIYLISGETYTLKVLPVTGSYATIYATLSESDGTTRFDYGDGVTFTPKSSGYCGVTLIVKSGYQADNIRITPQLEKATTATAYTPYIADISTVSVKRYGKNLIPYPYKDTTVTRNGVTFTDNGDGTITANGTATDNALFYVDGKRHEYQAGTYTISGAEGGTLDDNSYKIQVASQNNTIPAFNVTDKHTFTMNKADKFTILLVVYKGYTANNLIFKPMISLVTDKDYEPYIEPTTYTVEADGTVEGVKPLYPNTTLIADSGALIECEYNRDLNKAFEEITQAIISLGGNI